MSRYFPHTAYAEDQPLARTILTTHVLTRAVTTGTILGVTFSTLRQLIPSLRRPGGAFTPARLLGSAAVGSAVTVALSSLALVGRMNGRDEIEWKDRSWRLMESLGQLETDDWTYAGMGVGGVAALVRGSALAAWKGVVGGMGLGSVGGLLGYMTWRYGVNGGKFPEKKL